MLCVAEPLNWLLRGRSFGAEVRELRTVVILHIYPTIRDARKGFEAFVQGRPDRFNQTKLQGQLGDTLHFFMGLGLWSQFQKMLAIKADRVHLYFLPNHRTMAGIKAYSRVPQEHTHYYTQEVFHAG